MDAPENALVLVYLCSIIWDYYQDWVVLAQIASSMSESGEDCQKHKLAYVEPKGMHKLLANIAMSILLYEAWIWTDVISAKQCQKTEMVLVQLKCVG